MTTENCVKISYKGLTRHILCNTKFQYDELVKTVMDKFCIETSYKLAIEFYDEQGHKYNKDTFEYLLLLFPNPKKIFFIRLDTSKISYPSCTEGNQPLPLDDDRIAFGKSKLNNRQTTKNVTDTYCEAVPVRRQNCFLGEMPGSTTTQQQAISSTADFTQHLSLEVVKRLKQSPPKIKHLNNANLFKRSLRI